ncbi:MAG: hypothetical protein MJ240_05995 [Kiritimatiellae bacterium]|nr:hypothetical protein [Kiritimatiellia bacterium]
MSPFLGFAEEPEAWSLEPFHFSFRQDVRSAYLSRAKIVEDRPISAYDIFLSADCGDYGVLGTRFWGYSSLCNRRQHVHRRALNEVDYAPYWSYDLDIAQDWRLASSVSCWWITLPGFREDYRGKANNTQFEWWYEGALKNPYLTPSLLVRRGWKTAAWTYYKITLSKPLTLVENWVLTPAIYSEHGCETLYHIRYGAPRHGAHYHSGIMAAGPQLSLDWHCAKNLSLFLIANEHFLLNDKARDNAHAPNHRNYFVVQTGLKFYF